MNINKEVIMNNDKKEATSGAAENLREALVLRPEWEIKQKTSETQNSFTVTFSESKKVLELTVDGEVYRSVKVDDITSGKIKFHDALSHVSVKFDLWGHNAKN